MDEQNARRNFVKKAAYIAPAILTLAAAPAYAKAGSQKPDGSSGGREHPEHSEHPDHS